MNQEGMLKPPKNSRFSESRKPRKVSSRTSYNERLQPKAMNIPREARSWPTQVWAQGPAQESRSKEKNNRRLSDKIRTTSRWLCLDHKAKGSTQPEPNAVMPGQGVRGGVADCTDGLPEWTKKDSHVQRKDGRQSWKIRKILQAPAELTL